MPTALGLGLVLLRSVLVSTRFEESQLNVHSFFHRLQFEQDSKPFSFRFF